MNEWGRTTFGDPCRSCRFRWSIAEDDARIIVTDAPRRFDALVTGKSGGARHPDLQWTVAGYVCHIADSIRIWAERIAGAVLTQAHQVASFDHDLLAEARRYDDIDLRTALWSLRRSVDDWRAALQLAQHTHFEMVHDEVGRLSLTDVIRIRAHDVVHHAWDVTRILEITRQSGRG
jgi:hypothetical protein